MATVKVYNIEGKEVGSMELNDAIFGVEVNSHLMHMAVVQQLANKRQGTQSALTRILMTTRSEKSYSFSTFMFIISELTKPIT